MLTGRAARELPSWEQDIILRVAGEWAIDPAALAAVRLIENGREGREFGVLVTSHVPLTGLAPGAPSYTEQAALAAETISNQERRYARDTGHSPRGADGRYTEDFLRNLSARYAPVGAANDPRGLNSYHADNLVAAYTATAVA